MRTASTIAFLSCCALFAQPKAPVSPIQVHIVDDKYWHQRPENWVPVISVGIAVLAVGIAIWQSVLQRKSTELAVFEGVFRDLREADKEFKQRYELPLEAALNSSQLGNAEEIQELVENFDQELKVTSFVFFNTLEYMALLVNHHYINDKRLIGYFDGVLPAWRERLERATGLDLESDKLLFTEFKKLCKDRNIPKLKHHNSA
jgi:hypothetical protein